MATIEELKRMGDYIALRYLATGGGEAFATDLGSAHTCVYLEDHKYIKLKMLGDLEVAYITEEGKAYLDKLEKSKPFFHFEED